ncbi:ankyrin repeat-containing domain protein [Irpex rosettiformis]|uniref:Ankyrin repeat-containing domain protein n=1 Tax=Irpex rosettiformis TaxID=378272 RepID=A0ACB8TW63_9APHY|nr:ankyrin repeat-containing domain protein [Irpex rosettiformis]
MNTPVPADFGSGDIAPAVQELERSLSLDDDRPTTASDKDRSKNLAALVMAGETAESGSLDVDPTHTLTPEAIQFAHRMFNAARNGDDVLLHAVDAGLPVNLTNDEGNSLLMLAAYNGHADLASGLVERGADVNRVNDRGQSPLAGVVFKGYDEIAAVLAKSGADPRLGTPTAIQTARLFKKTELLSVLGATEDDMKEKIPLTPGPPPSKA